jgi:hypothetical protein
MINSDIMVKNDGEQREKTIINFLKLKGNYQPHNGLFDFYDVQNNIFYEIKTCNKYVKNGYKKCKYGSWRLYHEQIKYQRDFIKDIDVKCFYVFVVFYDDEIIYVHILNINEIPIIDKDVSIYCKAFLQSDEI